MQSQKKGNSDMHTLVAFFNAFCAAVAECKKNNVEIY